MEEATGVVCAHCCYVLVYVFIKTVSGISILDIYGFVCKRGKRQYIPRRDMFRGK